MKYLLIALIKAYWLVIPEKRRRKCLFRLSCSNYVYKKTKREGLYVGLKSLIFRIRNCNPNYHIIEINSNMLLISSTNQTFNEEEINHSIFKIHYNKENSLCNALQN